MQRKVLSHINCFLLLFTIVFAGANSAFPQDSEYNGIKGTDVPEFQESSDTKKCFVFGKYVVKTVQGEGGGENISVYKRSAATRAQDACQTTDQAYFEVNDSDNYFFYGLSCRLLFIDSGTSVESRGLELFNLNSRKSIFNESYTGDPKLVDGRFVFLDSPTDRKGVLKTCREAAKWKRDGGGVGWVQGQKLDLQTLKLVNV